MSNLTELAVMLFGVAIITTLMIFSFVHTPEVHFSQSTGECVRVHLVCGEGSCANLPKRYNHVWVK